MNDGEVGGAIQVWAMIAFALVTGSLARLLEPAAPCAAATLTVSGLIGAAGGVGYGIDSIQAAIFETGSIQETDSAVAPLSLQLPGVLFPVSLIGLGLMLTRSGMVAGGRGGPWLQVRCSSRFRASPTSRRWRLPPTPSW